MKVCKHSFLLLLLIFSIGSSSVAGGGTFFEEFSTKLDSKNWTIIRDAKNASVEVKDGKLVQTGVSLPTIWEGEAPAEPIGVWQEPHPPRQW